jgi:hypothetical protein
MGSETTGDEIMPEPTSPQFDALWTAAYRPRGGNINPDPRVAQSIYDNRQGRERYGNRTNELSELGRVHVDNLVNRLASHGGGHGRTGTEIASILRDGPQRRPTATSDPTTQAEEDAALAELNATPGDEEAEAEGHFLADPSGGGEWIGGEGGTHSGLPEDEFDYEDQNVRGPDYSQPDPFDRSNPVEDRQARAIEDMNETLGE